MKDFYQRISMTILGAACAGMVACAAPIVCRAAENLPDEYGEEMPTALEEVTAPAGDVQGPVSLEELFDPDYYAFMNPDVAQAVGNDPVALYQHFLRNGIRERRRFSPYLDLWSYIDNNSDLQEAFGEDLDAYVRHYFACGMQEGRSSYVSADDLELQKRLAEAEDKRAAGIAITNAQVYEQFKYEKAHAIIEEALAAGSTEIHAGSDGEAAGGGTVIIPAQYVTFRTIEELVAKCGEDVLLFTETDGNGNTYVLFVGGRFSDAKVTDAASAEESLACMKQLIGFPESGTVLQLNKSGSDSLGNNYYRFTAVNTECHGAYEDSAYILSATADGVILSLSAASPKTLVEDLRKDIVIEGLDITSNGKVLYHAENAENLNAAFAAIVNPNILKTGTMVGAAHTEFDPSWNTYVHTFYIRPYKNAEHTELEDYVVAYKLGINVGAIDVAGYYQYREDGDYSNSYTADYIFENDEIEVSEKKFVDYYGNVISLPAAKTVVDGETKYFILDRENKLIGMASDKSERFAQMEPLYFDDQYFAYVEAFETEADPLSVNWKELGYGDYYTLNQFVSAVEHTREARSIYVQEGVDLDRIPSVIAYRYNEKEVNASMAYETGALITRVFNCDLTAAYDVLAHEFGHGMVNIVADYLPYQNATGAINESYADILGNSLEGYAKLALGYDGNVDLGQWLLGEFRGACNGTSGLDALTSGDPDFFYDEENQRGKHMNLRSMGNPELHGQPRAVNGEYYHPAEAPTDENDNGNVHGNSGILNHVAYRMYQELFYDGEPGEEAQGGSAASYLAFQSVWYDSIQYLHNDSTYEAVEYGVLQSMKNHGYGDAETLERIRSYFADAKVSEYVPYDYAGAPDGSGQGVWDPENTGEPDVENLQETIAVDVQQEETLKNAEGEIQEAPQEEIKEELDEAVIPQEEPLDTTVEEQERTESEEAVETTEQIHLEEAAA